MGVGSGATHPDRFTLGNDPVLDGIIIMLKSMLNMQDVRVRSGSGEEQVEEINRISDSRNKGSTFAA
jgi:hypothetical protein